MNRAIEHLKSIYKNNDDFILREISINKKDTLYLAFFESLCDSKAIYKFVVKSVENYQVLNKKIDNIKNIISSPKLKEVESFEQYFYYLENGFCIIIFRNEAYAIEVKSEIDRGITITNTEPSLYGAKDSFCENYQKNLGVLKRRIKTNLLKVDSIIQGDYTKNKISLLYIDNIVDKVKLTKVKEKLYEYINKNVTDSYDVIEELKQNVIFPTLLRTEKPGLAARFILKGYIVIMVDNSPFVLIVDAKLDDFINPFTTDSFVKILRYTCLLLTILTPAIYIALINFNQEAIPVKLLVNFANQRSSVPFPAVIEALIMLFTCEILREADLKFPNSYGSAASILGALVLGEAAVNAGVVSPIMIIVVAITFITNLIFTEIKLIWAIRILRIIFLLVASFLGIYGLSIAFIISLSLVSNVKMYSGEYV